MNNNFMIKIKNLILSKSEGEFWDFKQEWHRDNERLLHDILCFANTVHEKDCYIIIGVSDNGDIVGIN
ncbi:ATP-binding protein, partial [Bacillus thuringiensis]|nr:ATP-binding protein [Bacillus thuringiensis]